MVEHKWGQRRLINAQNVVTHGAPKAPLGARRGRPVSFYPMRPIVEEVVCSQQTAAGVACKAHPMKGENVCVGHRRQQDAKKRNQESDTSDDTDRIG